MYVCVCVGKLDEKLEKMGNSNKVLKIIGILFDKLIFSHKMTMRNMRNSNSLYEIIIKIEVIKMVDWKLKIKQVCNEMAKFLIRKNESYGNSAFEPVGIFSEGNPLQNLNVRIDDKLNRLIQGTEYAGDDTIKDLCGYLILYMVLLEETQ